MTIKKLVIQGIQKAYDNKEDYGNNAKWRVDNWHFSMWGLITNTPELLDYDPAVVSEVIKEMDRNGEIDVNDGSGEGKYPQDLQIPFMGIRFPQKPTK